MPRPPSPHLNNPQNPPVETDTQAKPFTKHRSSYFKRTHYSTSSTSTSSDETDEFQEKNIRIDQEPNEANKDKPCALKNETSQEKNATKHTSDGCESRNTDLEKSDPDLSPPDNTATKAELDQLKDTKPIKNESRGENPSSGTTTNSSSTTKRSDGSPNGQPEGTSGTSTSLESATPGSSSSPTIAITVFNETTKVDSSPRRGRKAGVARKMQKRRPQPKRIPRGPPPTPQTEQPEEATPTAPVVPEAQTESGETSKEREKKPVNICEREFWKARKVSHDVDSEEWYIKLPAKGVVFVTNTETDVCTTSDHCEHEMRKIQNDHMDNLGLKDIAYNWVVGGDQTVYEGLGWDSRSPVAKNKKLNKRIGHHIYIGFLGRFEPEDLPNETLNYALAFIYLSMQEKYIMEDYETEVLDELIVLDNREYDIIPYL